MRKGLCAILGAVLVVSLWTPALMAAGRSVRRTGEGEELFDKVDTDGNGVISRAEFSKHLRSQAAPAKVAAKGVGLLADTRRLGMIDRFQSRCGVVGAAPGEGVRREPVVEILHIFQAARREKAVLPSAGVGEPAHGVPSLPEHPVTRFQNGGGHGS